MAVLRAAAVLASLLALAIGATPGVAARGGNTPVRGIVIGISSESMEVQSATGAVTVAITDETRVIRMVSGTVADLRRGQIVEFVLDARGRVAQLHIELPGTKLGPAPNRGRSQTRNRGPAQITAVSARTIRVRFANRRVVTYRLVSKPKVIKDVAGRVGDIAIGQTVLVTRSQGGRVAEQIVILRG
jgi:ABC-type microcin C transport system duplicated ATPase subunit YejF